MKKLIVILLIVFSFSSCMIYPERYETIDPTGNMYRYWDPIYRGYQDPFFLRPRPYYFYQPHPILVPYPRRGHR